VYFHRWLLLYAVPFLLFLASCGGFFSPQEEDDTHGVESLVAKPAKVVYGVGESFHNEDLRVYAIYAAGEIREISLDQVHLTGTGTYTSAGARTITAEFGGKTDSYTITVGSPGDGDGVWGGGNDGGGGIVIIWS
jgi:hypothetical protein